MQRMIHVLLIAFTLVLIPAAPTGAKNPAEPTKEVTRISCEELVPVLESQGFKATVARPHVVAAESHEGVRVFFFLFGEDESILAFAGFMADGDPNLVNVVNDWNSRMRYSRAYVTREGNAVLELDLDLSGGVTRDRIARFAKTARISVAAYAVHLGMQHQSQ
jgi:hypothetical protein